MSTEEVLDALERYTKESAETDRETATKLGVTQVLLSAWLQRAAQPEKCMLARLAGFLPEIALSAANSSAVRATHSLRASEPTGDHEEVAFQT